jgi:hypothetical protein
MSRFAAVGDVNGFAGFLSRLIATRDSNLASVAVRLDRNESTIRGWLAGKDVGLRSVIEQLVPRLSAAEQLDLARTIFVASPIVFTLPVLDGAAAAQTADLDGLALEARASEQKLSVAVHRADGDDRIDASELAEIQQHGDAVKQGVDDVVSAAGRKHRRQVGYGTARRFARL